MEPSLVFCVTCTANSLVPSCIVWCTIREAKKKSTRVWTQWKTTRSDSEKERGWYTGNEKLTLVFATLPEIWRVWRYCKACISETPQRKKVSTLFERSFCTFKVALCDRVERLFRGFSPRQTLRFFTGVCLRWGNDFVTSALTENYTEHIRIWELSAFWYLFTGQVEWTS